MSISLRRHLNLQLVYHRTWLSLVCSFVGVLKVEEAAGLACVVCSLSLSLPYRFAVEYLSIVSFISLLLAFILAFFLSSFC